MKRFISRLAIFALIIISTGVTIEILLRNIPNNYKFKKHYLDEHAGHIETLILGNSHLYYGINPSYLHTDAFNAGHVSQPLAYDYLLLEKYNQQWKKLSKIIIPIDYFSMFSNMDSGGEPWRKQYYKVYYNINATKPTDQLELSCNTFDLNITKIINYYLLNKKELNCSNLGWGTSYHSAKSKDLLKTGVKAAARHTYPDEHLLMENLRVLKRIFKFAQDRNIEVLLLTSPTYQSYYKSLNKKQLSRTLEETHRIAEEYHVRYVNLLEDNSFTKADFYDADHLNEIGARKLSLKVDSLLN
jgi:hypothetical protein